MQDEYEEIKARAERDEGFTGLTQGEIEEYWPDCRVEVIYDLELKNRYKEHLDENYPPVSSIGHTFYPSDLYEAIGPIDQRIHLVEFADYLNDVSLESLSDGHGTIYLVEGHNW